MKVRLILIVFSLIILSCLCATDTLPYYFGTGTGSVTTSNTASTTLLPQPVTTPYLGGDDYVYCSNGGGGGVYLNNPGLPTLGSGSEVRLQASSNTSANQFSIQNWTPLANTVDNSAFARIFVQFGDNSGGTTATSGTFYFFIGNGIGTTTDMFQGGQTTIDGNQIFAGYRWVINADRSISMASYEGNNGLWIAQTGFTCVQGVNYKFEFFCANNNGGTGNAYSHIGQARSLTNQKYDLWVDNILVGTALAAGKLGNNKSIDSFTFQAFSSTGNNGNIYIDGIDYHHALLGISIDDPTDYYSAPTGNLEITTNWWTNVNGIGGKQPTNFTSIFQTFHIQNNATPTLGGNWTVSGTSSSVSLGDSVNVITYTLPSAYTMTVTSPATFTAKRFGVFKIVNTNYPLVNTIEPGSTIEYAAIGAQNAAAWAYSNLTVSGSGTKTLLGTATAGQNSTVNAGDLALGNFNLTTTGSASGAGYFTYNGTGRLSGGIGSGTNIQLKITGTETLPATIGNLWINSAGSVTLGGSSSINDLILTSGLSLAATTTTIRGAVSGAAALTGGASSNISFTGAVASTNLPAVTLNNLNINRAAGIALGGNVTLTSLTIPSGSLSLNTKSLTFSGTPYLVFPGTGVVTSLSTSGSTNALMPMRINRQWTMTGGVSSTLYATFTWTATDDNTYNWTGRTPAVYQGSTKLTTISTGTRSITAAIPSMGTGDVFTIGLETGDGNLRTIDVTGAFTPFTTTTGTPSASQSVTVSGTILGGNISVAAVTGYEYATSSSGPWTSTLSLASSFNGSVFARLTGAAEGTFNGTIAFTSTGATGVNRTVTGTVTPPTINVTGTFSSFTTTTGTPSAAQSVAVSGTGLTGTLNVGAVTGYQYATSPSGPWTTTLSLPSSFNGNVYVRLDGSTEGTFSGNVPFTSTNAVQVDKAVTGTVTPPTINVTGSFNAFSTSTGTPSDYQTVSVSGTGLTGNLNVGAVNGYQYATNPSGPWTTTLSLPSSFNGNVYVRIDGSTEGTYTGSVPFTSNGVTSVDKPVTGTVVTQTITVEIISNIPGTMIYKDSIYSGFVAPHTFVLAPGSYLFGVMYISTQIQPTDITVTASGTYHLDYHNPPAVEGGGPDASTTYLETVPPTPVVIPVAADVVVHATVSYPGLLVITSFIPVSKGTYQGYSNVSRVIQVWGSDVNMIESQIFEFIYTPATPNYVAIHWGNDYYPAPAPCTGYAFNGAPVTAPNGGQLGQAPFTGSAFSEGVLTIGPVPTYPGKGPGTLEIILNDGLYDLPVELSTFNAVFSTSRLMVSLQWVTESETNNMGFNVLRSTDDNVQNAIGVNAHLITGTNTSSQQTYNFNDDSVEAPNTYYYWLESIDYSGINTFNGPVTVQVTDQGDPNNPPVIPVITKLNNAFPNPFNPETTISFDLKTQSFVTITVYDVKGRTIKTLTSKDWNAGRHYVSWNGQDENNKPVGSGIYFFRMTAGKDVATRKAILMK